MGMQSESKLEVWLDEILMHTLELKLQPFEVLMVVQTQTQTIWSLLENEPFFL